jgi:hypothetical protein
MYDAIVVGARCAGSPVAMLLARKGYKVLLVDRDAFPSDHIMSTHYIHQRGTAKLREWGLLDTVNASNCPPMSSFTFDVGPFALKGTVAPLDGISPAYCPRRYVIDNILVQAAVAEYEQRREQAWVPYIEFTMKLASLQPPPEEMQQLFGALRGNQPDTDRFLGIIAQVTSIPEFFAEENIGRIMAQAQAQELALAD